MTNKEKIQQALNNVIKSNDLLIETAGRVKEVLSVLELKEIKIGNKVVLNHDLSLKEKAQELKSTIDQSIKAILIKTQALPC